MNEQIMNPFISKILNQTYRDEEYETCSYRGVIAKIIYFFLVTVISIILFFKICVNNNYLPVILAVALAVAVIVPFLNYMIPSKVNLLGTMFSLSQGIIIGYLIDEIPEKNQWIIFLSLLTVIGIVVIMCILYGMGIVRVGEKLKAIISTLFLILVIIGGIIGISGLFNNPLSEGIISISVLSIIGTVIGLVITVLNLAVDFDNIGIAIVSGKPKKYEWMLAFGIVMSIILIFIRILKLLISLIGGEEDD